MANYLFIVSREHPLLHDYLCERFADDRNVRVILDRRGVRSPGDSPEPVGHGSRNRRVRPGVDEEIRTSAHALVDLQTR